MFVSDSKEGRVRTRTRWAAKQSGLKSAVFNKMVVTLPGAQAHQAGQGVLPRALF